MLELLNVHAAYGRLRVLEDVSLKVGEREIVCLLGANGAGKTTTLNCISGLVRVAQGEIRFEGMQFRKDIGHRAFGRR